MQTVFSSDHTLLELLLDSQTLTSSSLRRTSYPKGQVVDDSDGSVPLAVFVEEGELDVFSVALDGTEILVSTLVRPEVFGISNLFEEEQLRTVLECRTDCVLLSLPKDELRRAILKSPLAMVEYAKLCNRKIQFLIRRIEQLSLTSARAKVVDYLLSHTTAGQPELSLVSKASLTLPLGISRATLFRELSVLEKMEAVYSNGSTVRVINRKILETVLQK
ncbi:MAG: Crp/Fnr family transcriptional regulator [Spirochaetia bacterium]|nr:Crp/Fnr family transcriptional regulator [Spirochaetia bacterium]